MKKLKITLWICIYFIIWVPHNQAQYIVKNFAGGNPEGIPATEAALSTPRGVAKDASGNIYIAEIGSDRVRKVATDGTITTLAGIGIQNSTGDGGLAINAALSNPTAVAIGPNGNVYIADQGNNRIRMVHVNTGIITTVAGGGSSLGDGGLATAARLNGPEDIAFDSQGNLYIADKDHHRIRKVNASDGIISTVAGMGSSGYLGDGGLATAARLHRPTGVAFDQNDNLYIADFSNNAVRKVNASDGIISTVAGNGSFGNVTDGNLATSGGLFEVRRITVDNNNDFYFSTGFSVRKVTVTTGIIGTVSITSLNSPYAITFDSNGDFFVASQNNRYVLKVASATGPTTIVAGNGLSSYAAGTRGDGGKAANALLASPRGMTRDAQGNLFLVNYDGHSVRKISATDSVITTLAGTGTAGFSGDGGPGTSATLFQPTGIVVDATGNIYFSDANNHRIRKVATDGTITTVVGTGSAGFSGDGGLATAAQLFAPRGLVFDASGNLYIADASNRRVRKVATNGIITTVAGTGSSGFSGDGGAATAATLNLPYGIAVDASGNLYIADRNEHRVRKIDAVTGIISTVAGNGGTTDNGDGGLATAAAIRFPNGVAIDNGGNLYIASEGRLRKVDANTGIISTIAGNSNNNSINEDGSSVVFADLVGIALATNGEIFVTDERNHRVAQLIPATELDVKLATNAIATGNTQNLGDVPFGTATSLTFTIENNGTSNLFLNNVAISGSDFSITQNPALTVAAGGSTTLTVTLDVNSVGAKSGTLTFRGNDLNESNYTINLSANVIKANQTINFSLGTNATKVITDADFMLSATGGASGNPIIYNSSDANVATISGSTVTIVGVGTTTITASQAGNANYNAATDVTQTLTVNKLDQTITFSLGTNATKTFGEGDFVLSATGGASGNAVTFASSDASIATISGNTVSIVGAGSVTITASQAGNATYSAAADVIQTLLVNKANQTITFDLGANTTKVIGDADFTLSATGGATGNPVTYTSTNTNVATISGNTVSIVGVGVTTITANQAGNANYNDAVAVTQTLTVQSTVTGLPGDFAEGKITLFPNPVINELRIQIEGKVTNQPLQITLMNSQGKVVSRQVQELVNGQVILPLHRLSGGSYLVQIQQGKETILRRMIKK
ncbi:hypothetical protein BKI52_27925 [marine bacterium AO1-C]|nr:hypothetical protein BKI52_27925 [marine bacterium AO1-C]